MLEPRAFICADCGATFMAKRENATYCSPTCRKRASLARGGQPVERREPATVPAPVVGQAAPTVNQPIPDPPLVAKVIRSLEAANKLDTWEGEMAVTAARKLASAGTTAASAGSLMDKLEKLMAKLTVPAGGIGPGQTSRRGTLATRRNQKRGAAA
jgi:hypothetical protein